MDLFKLVKDFKNGKAKDNSINSYVICVRKLHEDKDFYDLDLLEDKEFIMSKINAMEYLTTRKNYLNAVCVCLEADGRDNKFYLQMKRDVVNEYNSFLDKNIMTTKQKNNWLKVKDLHQVSKNLLRDIKKRGLYNKNKDEINADERSVIQDYLISLLYTEINPIRLDYAPMKIVYSLEHLHQETNYLYIKNKSNKTFIINNYKNVKSRGSQQIKVPKKVNDVINRWLKINPTENFLISLGGNALTENALGKYISRIFTIYGRTASLNIIRHIIVSESIDIEKTKEQKELADNMSHSTATQLSYAKHLDK